METLTKISFVIYTLSIIFLLAVIIWAGYKSLKEKNERKRREFLDMSTKINVKKVDNFLKEEAKEFLQNVNL